MKCVYLGHDSLDDEWLMLDSEGLMVPSVDGPGDVVSALAGHRVSCICRDRSATIAIAVYLRDRSLAGYGPLPAVTVRGDGGGSMALVGVADPADVWHVATGEAMCGARDAAKIAGPEPAELAARVSWSRDVREGWTRLVDGLGLDGGKLSAGTAAAGLIPSRWIRASAKLNASQAWLDVRATAAGGRIQLFKQGWTGDAVEWDIGSAYGAAMAGLLGRMPDCQLYPDTVPMSAQPGWYDVTVEVFGSIGPLPYRDPAKPWALEWPTSGRWRQWYSRVDLEQPGVRVVEVHRVHAGRYMWGLRDAVLPLLERRDVADGAERAVIRQLVVSLAGKLAQKPVRWRVWSPAIGYGSIRAPPSAVHIGDPFGHSGLTIYPVRPEQSPPTVVPMLASYVTARTRATLYGALIGARGEAIYCDTDGIHLPASAPPPIGYGTGAGDWIRKTEGAAVYHSRRRYVLGAKRVNC